MRLAVVVAIPVLALAGAAWADEVIQTHSDQAPAPQPAADPGATVDDVRQANGDWARRVMAGQPTAEEAGAAEPRGCRGDPDGRPHGAVWAGVGTGGYGNVGGVVTQPIGECGSVTIAIDHSQIGDIRRSRRR